MLNYSKEIANVVNYIFTEDAYSAVKYVTPETVIKATRRGALHFKHTEVVVSVGRPNYLERFFIKKAKKAGESFPIKKIQLAFLLLIILYTGIASAAQITAVTIANGKLNWNWTPGTTPLVDDGTPTEFRAKCGLSSGVYTLTKVIPFISSPTNNYNTPLASFLNSNAQWFCIVSAANLVGEAVSTEINFFGGTAPKSPTNVGVVQ